MDDKQKFEAFKQRVVDWHQETYGAERQKADMVTPRWTRPRLRFEPDSRAVPGVDGWAGSSDRAGTSGGLRRFSGGGRPGGCGRSTAAGSPSPATRYDPPSTGSLAELYVSGPTLYRLL